jgi:hypothetical protein
VFSFLMSRKSAQVLSFGRFLLNLELRVSEE